MSNLDIFVYSHKPFSCPVKNCAYKVLTCSREEFPNVGIPVFRDYTGDNISDKNLMYNEYSGIYWVWKNYEMKDFVGINHYRRYFTFMDNVPNISDYFEFFDIILNKPLQLADPFTNKPLTNRESYAFWHNVEDFDLLEQVIREKYPEYTDGFVKMKNSKEIFNSSIFIMRKEMFKEYCEFIFSVLDTYNDYHGHHTVEEYISHVEKNKDLYLKPKLKYYNTEIQSRIVGYIAERALNTFLLNGKDCIASRSVQLQMVTI